MDHAATLMVRLSSLIDTLAVKSPLCITAARAFKIKFLCVGLLGHVPPAYRFGKQMPNAPADLVLGLLCRANERVRTIGDLRMIYYIAVALEKSCGK